MSFAVAEVPLPQMAAEVEALAWHRAVQFATEFGLQEVIFEGDAEVLIKMLQQNEFEFVPYGQIIEDINFSFSVKFSFLFSCKT